MNLNFVVADEADKDFILHANKEIDIVSGIFTSKLQQNLSKDVLQDKKSVCLIAKFDGVRVGMIMFSKVYWADRGQGVYVSQAFVEENYRRKGILRAMFQQAFDHFEGTQFVTCLVGKDNVVMRNCVKKMNFEYEDMCSYVVNKDEFIN